MSSEQQNLLARVHEAGINIVRCGMCGIVMLHERGAEELTCPLCGFQEDPCHFPDAIRSVNE